MRAMFHTVAPRYDFITRAFSYGMDGRWKQAGVKRALLPEKPVVLDLASGTGDFSALVSRHYPGSQAVAVDLTERMLRLRAPARRPAHDLRRRRPTSLPRPVFRLRLHRLRFAQFPQPGCVCPRD